MPASHRPPPRLPALDGPRLAALRRAVALLRQPRQPGEEFFARAVASVQALVPGQVVAANAYRADGDVVLTRSNLAPASAVVQATLDPFHDLYSTHPAAQARAAGDLFTVATASDYVGLRAFRATALHTLVYRPLRVDYQLYCFFATGGAAGQTLSLTSMRDGRDYSRAERAAMAALRPHLQAAAALEASVAAGAPDPLAPEEALKQLGAAWDETGRSLIVSDGEGRVRYHTPGAAPLMVWLTMQRGGDGCADRLPPSTRAWFSSQVVAMRATDGRYVAPDWPFEVEGCQLRLVGADVAADRYRITLERVVPHREQVAWLAHRLNLTRREAQVLFWVCRGKNNPEIAVILGVERSTVRKHLEHTFARIGVENRLAAAALVNQLGPAT